MGSKSGSLKYLKPRAHGDPHVDSLDAKLKNYPHIKRAVDAACKRAKIVSEEKKKKQEVIEAAAKKKAESEGRVYDGTVSKHVEKEWKVNGDRFRCNCSNQKFDELGNPSRIDKVEKERRLAGVGVLVDDLGKEPRHLTEGEIQVLAERENYRVVGYVNHPFRIYLNFETAQRAANDEEDAEGEEITGRMLEDSNSYKEGNKDYLVAVTRMLTKMGHQRGSVRGAKVEEGTYQLQHSLRNNGYCFLPDGRVVCRDNHLQDILSVTEESGKQYSQHWDRWKAYTSSNKYRTDNEASAESARLLSGLSVAETTFQDDEDDYAEFAASTTTFAALGQGGSS